MALEMDFEKLNSIHFF